MNRSYRRLFAVIALLVLLAIPFQVALAAPARADVPDINQLLLEFAALAGVGGLISFLVNLGKSVGIVKDGDAPKWVTGANLLGLVALFALKVFVPNVDVLQLDGLAATLAQLGVLVLGLITQLGGSRLAYNVVKGTPLIGTSYSYKLLG